MKINKNIYSFSHIGNSRKNHEDNYILRKGDFLSPRARKTMEDTRKTFVSGYRLKKSDFMVAVADGMGGHSSGEVASLLTVQYLSERYKKFIKESENVNKLISELSNLNQFVTKYSRENSECGNMGSTLCGIIYKNGRALGFNIGDSRLYRLKNKQLTQLSVDHTEGQRLLNLKLLTEEDVESFPRKKHLYKYVGLDGELIADIFEIEEITENSLFLLCSDGLTDALSDSEIESVLKNGDDVSKKGLALINSALQRNQGYGDNITVILIDVRKDNEYAG